MTFIQFLPFLNSTVQYSNNAYMLYINLSYHDKCLIHMYNNEFNGIADTILN